MSFNDAHAFAFSLAATLMVAIVIFQAATAASRSFPPPNTTATPPTSFMKSIPSPHDGASVSLAPTEILPDFRSNYRPT